MIDEAQHKNHSAYFVPGLQRGLHVLEVVGEAEKPMTVSEIARAIGVSRSSAFRLVYTLRQMEFLKSAFEDRAVELGPRVLNLGFAYLSRQDIIRVARPHLELLTSRTNVSSHLAVRDHREVLYLDCVLSNTPFVTTVTAGTRAPAYATALGWILLGSLDSEDLRSLYAGKPMPKRTDETPVTPDALLGRVRAASREGYVVSRGFSEPGGSSINAPIYDHARMVTAAIDISGPDAAFDFDRMSDHYLPAVIDAAQAISKALGSRSGDAP
jgi:DNA-binding IclR family transcriptional regulator